MHNSVSPADLLRPGSTRILTVTQTAALYPAFSENALRWLIHKANENGLQESGALVRVRRRVLIDEQLFLAWARSASQQENRRTSTRPRSRDAATTA